MSAFTILQDRGLLTVGGSDRSSFLQGLISNDIDRVTKNCAIWAALLTPQGKYLHDFFITEIEGRFFLDCEGTRLMDLGQRLSKYKLRASVDFGIEESMTVATIYGCSVKEFFTLDAKTGAAAAFCGGIVYRDPRLNDMGVRAILKTDTAKVALQDIGLKEAPAEEYDSFRLSLGIPDGSRDMLVEKSILLESNFEELNGVDWNKGCYMGQELTARTKYRGLIKKRMVPIKLEGSEPAPGTSILCGAKRVGEIRSVRSGLGMALIRLEYIERSESNQVKLLADGVQVTPRKPAWANF